MKTTLYYVHDPMCSWCYAFSPVLQRLELSLPDSINMTRLLGGLAPDTDQAMEPAMRQRIEETWRRIEKEVPGTRFNFDFWQQCTPYRSTYQSCRAVIAASLQDARHDKAMTTAIQRAYYQQARNPSETATLISLAEEMGLDVHAFTKALNSPQVEKRLQQQIHLASSIGADSYPSLILGIDDHHWPISIDYNDPAPILDTLLFLLNEHLTE